MGNFLIVKNCILILVNGVLSSIIALGLIPAFKRWFKNFSNLSKFSHNMNWWLIIVK